MTTTFTIDDLTPPEIALKAETISISKGVAPGYRLFVLAILAGAFIAMGAAFATTIWSGSMAIKSADGLTSLSASWPYGVTRLLGALAFCLGLIMVIVGGAELFTGNVLMMIAWASRKVTTKSLLRNWTIVYLGNAIGAVASAGLVFLSNQYLSGSGAVGLQALNIGTTKAGLSLLPAIASGILCNALVCMAVWMCYGARNTLGKVSAIVFPITAFVALGFEHSVANMYFGPVALLIKEFADPSFWSMIGKTPADFGGLTWGGFVVNNLVPVTIGNIVGGAVLVAALYWISYLKDSKPKEVSQAVVQNSK